MVVILVPSAFASYWHYLTIGQGDDRYCKQYGICVLQNLTVIGGFFNVSVIDYNVTGGMSIGGDVDISGDLHVGGDIVADGDITGDDINANYFSGDGSEIFNINCSNIIGGNDTDFCSDHFINDTGVTQGDNIYLYADATTMYLNETKLNQTIIDMVTYNKTYSDTVTVAAGIGSDVTTYSFQGELVHQFYINGTGTFNVKIIDETSNLVYASRSNRNNEWLMYEPDFTISGPLRINVTGTDGAYDYTIWYKI